MLGWKNSFKTCSSRNAAILNTVTEMTAADIARAGVTAGRNMATLLRRHDIARAGVTAGRNMATLLRKHVKFEVVALGENL